MTKERAGLPFETLEDKVLFYPRFDARKHNLHPDPEQYARERVNEMTNMELLEAISIALADTT